MSRKKIIKELKIKNPALTILEIENILDIFTESIVNALKDGEENHFLHVTGLADREGTTPYAINQGKRFKSK